MSQWVRIQAELPQSRKIKLFAGHMGLSTRDAVGGLVMLWASVRTTSPDGDTSHWSPEEFAASMDFPMSEANNVYKALKAAKLLTDDGKIYSWMEHNGQFLKDAERMRTVRARSRTVREPSVMFAVRGEERRGEEKKHGGSIPHTPSPPAEPANGSWAAAFDDFWVIYPRKVGKLAARRCWERIKPKTVAHKVAIVQAVKNGIESEAWQKNNGQFIPNPSTWLNQGRWMDEAAPLLMQADPFEQFKNGGKP